MNRTFSLALLTFGIIVLILGYRAANAPRTVLVHLVTGYPTRESTWMIVAGTIAAVAGLAGLFRGQK